MELQDKNPYVLVSHNGKVEYWPYPEVQEFSSCTIDDSSIIWLTYDELKKFEGYLK